MITSKIFRNSFFFIVITLISIIFIGCAVTTDIHEGNSSSFNMNGSQNSGYESTIIDKGSIFDARTRERYNNLIETYSDGVQSYKFNPPLYKDYGITEVIDKDNVKKYLFSPSAMQYFRVMNLARKNGLPPYTKLK